jgi:hypothetical protein
LTDRLLELSLNITLPKYNEFPVRYKSFQRFVLLPNVYVALTFGIKLPNTKFADRLPTLALPATLSDVNVPRLVILAVFPLVP